MEFLFVASAVQRTLEKTVVHEVRYEYSAKHFRGESLELIDEFLHGNQEIGEYTSEFDRYGREVLVLRTA